MTPELAICLLFFFGWAQALLGAYAWRSWLRWRARRPPGLRVQRGWEKTLLACQPFELAPGDWNQCFWAPPQGFAFERVVLSSQCCPGLLVTSYAIDLYEVLVFPIPAELLSELAYAPQLRFRCPAFRVVLRLRNEGDAPRTVRAYAELGRPRWMVRRW